MPKVWPEEYVVHVSVTTHHYVRIKVPEQLRAVGDSAAMDAVRAMPPEKLRHHPATGTTAYVLGAQPVEQNVTPQ